jgi:hypothetical protein
MHGRHHQHIVTTHHHRTKPDRAELSTIRSGAGRWGREDAYLQSTGVRIASTAKLVLDGVAPRLCGQHFTETRMPWGSIITSEHSLAPHHYSTYEPDDFAAWIEVVAAEYVALRTACCSPIPDVLEFPGMGAFSGAAIQARIAKATVPEKDYHKKNFSVLRSDLSEVAAYMLLERTFGTEIAFKLVRDRELKKLPGRGIDAIGVEVGDKHVIVLAEVKFSDEACKGGKAPGVVDSSSDCMRVQHLGHINDRQETIDKLLDCMRRSPTDAERNNLLAAALYLENELWEQLDLVSCCVLVRPKERHTEADFGSFRSSPSDYDPARVRFLVWKLPGDMESILTAWADAVEKKVAQV